MKSQENKLLVDKVESESSKLERRFKDAERRLKYKVHQFDEKIVNSYKRRKSLLNDRRNASLQAKEIEKIGLNAEKIKKIIFNLDFPLSGHKRRQFIKLVAKIQSSYSELKRISGASRIPFEEKERDLYFKLGVNIAELSEDLVDLILDSDPNTQSLLMATCSDIEESCDTLAGRVNRKYNEAA